MGITNEQALAVSPGLSAVYAGAVQVGVLGQIYLDEAGRPSWATVTTGLFGALESFVPLEGAEISGGRLVVAYPKALVDRAPRVEADAEISRDAEDELYRYYGLEPAAPIDPTRQHVLPPPGSRPASA